MLLSPDAGVQAPVWQTEHLMRSCSWYHSSFQHASWCQNRRSETQQRRLGLNMSACHLLGSRLWVKKTRKATTCKGCMCCPVVLYSTIRTQLLTAFHGQCSSKCHIRKTAAAGFTTCCMSWTCLRSSAQLLLCPCHPWPVRTGTSPPCCADQHWTND